MSITNQIDQAADSANKITEAANEANSALENLRKGTVGLTSGIFDSSNATNKLIGSIGNIGSAAEKSTNMVSALFDIFGFGGISASLDAISNLTSGMAKLGEGGIKGFIQSISAMDAPSENLRNLNRTFFDLTKTFGLSADEAENFTESFSGISDDKFVKDMLLSADSFQKFSQSIRSTDLGMDTLQSTVKTAYGEIDLYTMAIAQADAAGIGASESARLFNTLISKQGMTAQTASETIAGFSAVAKETGLNFSTISTTLSSAIYGYEKIGMTADFSRPILENFAKTVKSVGLGVEEATSLTRDMVQAMGGLSDNYGLSYLTQLRSGGSPAGVLDASIQMRQRMREAEESGEQGAMAIEMAKQIRDVVASMTGGNIITLEDAANSPELQSQFYMQGQMLSQYGIRDTKSQDLVLDLLSKIDQAESMGDSTGMMELSESLRREIDAKNRYTSETEKLDKQVSLEQMDLAINTKEAGEIMREISKKMREEAEEVLPKVFEKMEETLNSGANNLKEAFDAAGDVVSFFKKNIEGLKNNPSRSNEDGSPPDLKDTSNNNLSELFQSLIKKLDEPLKVVVEPSQELRELISSSSNAFSINTQPG